MGIVFFPFPCMRLSDWRKECYVRFRRLYEENLADIYSSANSVGDVCPNSEDSDSISPDPASILSSATETIVIAFWFGTNTLVQQLLCSSHDMAEAFGSLDTEKDFLLISGIPSYPSIRPLSSYKPEQKKPGDSRREKQEKLTY